MAVSDGGAASPMKIAGGMWRGAPDAGGVVGGLVLAEAKVRSSTTFLTAVVGRLSHGACRRHLARSAWLQLQAAWGEAGIVLGWRRPRCCPLGGSRLSVCTGSLSAPLIAAARMVMAGLILTVQKGGGGRCVRPPPIPS